MVVAIIKGQRRRKEHVKIMVKERLPKQSDAKKEGPIKEKMFEDIKTDRKP